MNFWKISGLILALVIISHAPVLADDEMAATQKKEIEHQADMVQFGVPALTEDHVKKVAEVLKDEQGVFSVKPDMETKQLTVIFDKGKTHEDKIQKLLSKVFGEDIKVLKVEKVTYDPKKGCGACPHK
ncbi:hypothetical protein JW979_07655, partial [bacterium]|nr:hypothetical protein [candidate division CSSED10-310 bacterium]